MNFDDMMTELRLEYVNSIPQKIKDIESHIDIGINEQLRDDFHKIKGTGKTYGIPEMSLLGEVVEKLVMNKHDQALAAAKWAVRMLAQIYDSRKANRPFAVEQTAEYVAFRKLI